MPPVSDKVKRLLKKFSAATIRAAMAERPEVMQASGWRYDENDELVQDAQDTPGAEKLRKSLSEIAMVPLGDVAGEVILGIPAVARGLAQLGTTIKRYSPEGRALTKRIQEAVANIDDIVVKSGGVSFNPELREYLIKEGVDPRILTDDVLAKLTRGREQAIISSINSAPERVVMRGVPEDGFREYMMFQPGYPQVNPHYPEGTIGYIQTYPIPPEAPVDADGTMVSFVKNITEHSDDVQHGISRLGYDAVIKDKGNVVSGIQLMHPEKTMHVLDKYYPNKELLGNFGQWTPIDAEPVLNTPVYRLSESSQPVLLKNSDVFSAKSIGTDGSFLVDYASDAFHAGGGIINRYDIGGLTQTGYYSPLPIIQTVVPYVPSVSIPPVIDARKDAARRIRAVENSKKNPKGGWNEEEQRWYPHSSYEGGADTIAYGIKLSNGSPEAKLALKQGYLTDEQANSAVDTLVDKYYNAAQRVYDKKYGAGEWDKLSDWSQSILTDYSYNPGLAKFPSLMEGFHSGDMDKILANYKRYSGGKPLGRNKILLSEIQQLNDVYPIFRADGGKIHIKPENRGKFTALKERTGHSASWFKAHGTPSQKKMATFALNSRKWKHAEGGILERLGTAYNGDTAAMLEMIQRVKAKRNA